MQAELERRRRMVVLSFVFISLGILGLTVFALITQQPMQYTQELTLRQGQQFCFESPNTDEVRTFRVVRVDNPPLLEGTLPPFDIVDNPLYMDINYWLVSDTMGPFLWLTVQNQEVTIRTPEPSRLHAGAC